MIISLRDFKKLLVSLCVSQLQPKKTLLMISWFVKVDSKLNTVGSWQIEHQPCLLRGKSDRFQGIIFTYSVFSLQWPSMFHCLLF